MIGGLGDLGVHGLYDHSLLLFVSSLMGGGGAGGCKLLPA